MSTTTNQKFCPNCGKNDFFILEFIGWKASVDEEGQIQAHINTNEIDSVSCRQCNAEFEPTFFGMGEINFN